MQIRKCSESDIIPTGAFYDKVVAWLDAHINYPKWVYKIYPSEESVKEMTDIGCQYICIKDGEIQAAFVLNADPQGKYENASWIKDLPEGSYMVLHTLAVSPEIQGKGLASEVIRFCITEAKKQGYQALRLDIVPENLPARRLYKKTGLLVPGMQIWNEALRKYLFLLCLRKTGEEITIDTKEEHARGTSSLCGGTNYIPERLKRLFRH